MKKSLSACVLLTLLTGTSQLATANVLLTTEINKETVSRVISSEDTANNTLDNVTSRKRQQVIVTDKNDSNYNERVLGSDPRLSPNASSERFHSPYHRNSRHSFVNPPSSDSKVVTVNPNTSTNSFNGYQGRDQSVRVPSPAGTVVTVTPSHGNGANNFDDRQERSSFVNVPSSHSTVVTVNSNDEQQFRNRHYREQQQRDRELTFATTIHPKQQAFQERQWYENQLHGRIWQDMTARDQELRYLMWRERQNNRYWHEQNRICRYETRFVPIAITNSRITVCEQRQGVRICYHPKRYIIRPLTRIVCYRNRPNFGSVIIHNR